METIIIMALVIVAFCLYQEIRYENARQMANALEKRIIWINR